VKKTMLGLLCLVVAMACDFPQSVTVTGKPGVLIPIGSPFSLLDEDKRLENIMDPDSIRERMREQNSTVKIYDYLPFGPNTDNLQTYIVHYPIVKMQHDLTDYVNEVLDGIEALPLQTIPGNVDTLPPGVYYITPTGVQPTQGESLFTVPLADMSKLVVEVNGTAFGIELGWSQSFEDKLQFFIPAFGFDDYQYGVHAGDKLRFYNPAIHQFKPEDLNEDGELEIFVRVLGACSGTIKLEAVFDWDDALVDISDDQSGTLTGDYEIENFLVGFLGEGVAFKKVKAYIYVYGIADAKIELSFLDENHVLQNIVPQETPLDPVLRPEFPLTEANPFGRELPDHSVTDRVFIDLTALLNRTEPSTLKYDIKANSIPIYNNPGQLAGNEITADLVIELPLEFIVTTPSSEPGYVKLDLKDADGKSMYPEPGEKDLFGRTDGEDDLFSNINLVTILVKDPRNTIIGNNISVLLMSPDTDPDDPFQRIIDIDFARKESSKTIGYTELPNPFKPSFEILLPEDSPGEATLSITRPPPGKPRVFDFFLAVEARTDLNIEL